MGKLNVTLYDLLGYIIPGVLANLVFIVFLSQVTDNMSLVSAFLNLGMLWQFLFGYVSGHIMQIITSILLKCNYVEWWRENGWNENIKQAIESSLKRKLRLDDEEGLSIGRDVVHFAGYYIRKHDEKNKVDVFRASLGFFRGMVGVFILSALSFGYCYFASCTIFVTSGPEGLTLKHNISGAIAILSIVLAWLSYIRFKKFCAYRLEEIMSTYYVNEVD